MATVGDIADTTKRLKILKSLLGNTINDPEVIQLLQDEIDSMELAAQEEVAAEEDLSAEGDTSGEGEDLSGLFDDGGASSEGTSSGSSDDIFADLFAGTGAVSSAFCDKTIITNDILYSNYICNLAWFGPEKFNIDKIKDIICEYNALQTNEENFATIIL